MIWLLSALLACDERASVGGWCACEGLGVQLCERGDCGPCMCLPYAAPTADPEPATTFYVDPDAAGGDGSAGAPWAAPDWGAIDAALAAGHVSVLFSAAAEDGAPQVWPERLDVLRTDGGEHRLLLDGGAAYNADDADPDWRDAPDGARAIVPGVHTGYDDVSRDRITVRRFEVTGSDDKGVYWRAGSRVVIEDNLIHDNRGSPSISLDYVSRSGLPSSGFAVRNNHVWDQRGECVYIGGSEGQEIDAHAGLVIENNLIHDCWKRLGDERDGINVKDRITDVTVARNVVFNTDWGIETASPGEYSGNLIWGTARNGFHVTDGWGLGLSGATFQDNAVLWAGHAGAYLNATNNRWQDVTFTGLTIVGADEAGIELGGPEGVALTIDDLVLADNAVGLDAWDPMELALGACRVDGNGLDDDRDLAGATGECDEGDVGFGDLSVPAGPDGVFFTEDDPWLVAGGAGL